MAPAGSVHPAPGSEGAGDLDLNQLGVAISRARTWIALPTVLVLIASAVAVALITPRYTGEAKLILQSGDSYFTRPSGSTDPGIGPFDEREMASQVQLASSRELIRAAIDRLKLRGNPEFDKYASPGIVRSLLMTVGLMRRPTEIEREDSLVDSVKDRVLAFSVGLSRVLTIEFSAYDPQFAATGANTFAELFIESQAEAKKQAARAAGAWLINTIEPLRERVAQAEAKVEEFRARKGLLASGNNATLPQQQLSEMNTQLSAARSAQADAQARAKLIRDALAAGRPQEISDVANNELVRKLSADRSALRAQMGLEARTLLPGHPRMKELQAQLATVESEIRASAEKAVRTLENDARVQGARVDQITAALDMLKGQSAQASEDEVELRALEREARSQRDQLEAMLARYREAMARDAKDAVPADARVISRAFPPAFPSFPKRVPIVLVATLSTLLVAIAIVVTRELLSGRAYVGAGRVPAPPIPAPAGALGAIAPRPHEEEDGAEPSTAQGNAQGNAQETAHEPAQGTERETPQRNALVDPAPVAAATDRLDPATIADAPTVVPDPLPSASVQEAIARVSIASDQAGSLGALALIVSSRPDVARDAAFVVGRTAARRRRVALVDLAGHAAGEDRPGIGDVVAGQANFLQALQRDAGSRLHLVGPGQPITGDAAVWQPVLRRSLDALRGAYECVLVCAPSPAVSQVSQAVAGDTSLLMIAATSPAAQGEIDAIRAAIPPGAADPVLLVLPAAEPALATG